MMQAILKKQGDSRVISIPEMYFQDIQFPDNEYVSVSLENRKIVIGAKRKTLKERLVDFYGEDYRKHSFHSGEVDWGAPVGDEVW